MKPILILGGGGHAKVLIDAMRCSGRYQIRGIIDKASERLNHEINGIPILGNEDCLKQHPAAEVDLVNAVGSTVSTKKRRDLFDLWRSMGYSFATIIHPGAIISSDAFLKEGAQVMAGAVINTGVEIGMNTIINTGAIIDHDCVIGDHVHTAPGVTLSGGVRVGPNVHIGTGAIVIQGVRIGSGVLIAAGSVVTQDIGDSLSVKGVPAAPFLSKRGSHDS